MSTSQQAQAISDLIAAIYHRAHPQYSLTLSHAAVRALQHVAFADDPTVGTLADFLGCAHNTASEIVQRLTQKGLVTRMRSETDERIVRPQLTDRGRQILAEQTGLDVTRVAAGLASLTADERAAIVRALEHLASCL